MRRREIYRMVSPTQHITYSALFHQNGSEQTNKEIETTNNKNKGDKLVNAAR